jgi:hypothetical protein
MLVTTIIMFLNIIHHPLFYVRHTVFFGDLILSLSSGGTYSVGPSLEICQCIEQECMLLFILLLKKHVRNLAHSLLNWNTSVCS